MKGMELRLFRGESVDALSRKASVPIYRLEQWRDRALAGIDSGLKERENDPVEKQLDEANRRIGELVMEVEIMRKERRAKHPLVGRSAVLIGAVLTFLFFCHCCSPGYTPIGAERTD